MRALFFINEEVLDTVSWFDPFLSLASTTVVCVESSLAVILNCNTLVSSLSFHIEKVNGALDLFTGSYTFDTRWGTSSLLLRKIQGSTLVNWLSLGSLKSLLGIWYHLGFELMFDHTGQ